MDTTHHTAGEQWEFRCKRTGTWRWRCLGEERRVRAVSSEAFPSLDAAIEDAARNGFNYTARYRSS